MIVPSSALPWLVKALSAFVAFNGLRAVTTGIEALDIDSSTSSIAVVDSQMRYHGAFTAGVAAIGWWSSNSLSERRAALAIIGITIILTGIARALSASKYGHGKAWTRRAMWTELLAPFVLWAIGKWN